MVSSSILLYCTGTLPCNKVSRFCHVAYSGFAISPRKRQFLIRLECCSPVIDKNSLINYQKNQEKNHRCTSIQRKFQTQSIISAYNNKKCKFRKKDFSLKRSYCCSNDITRGGRRPRSPRRSLSVKGNAVSCLKVSTTAD
jgi:hypothetical protein